MMNDITRRTGPIPPGDIERIRSFNRFYTKQIGLLRNGLLGSKFTLSEAHILFEIAHSSEPTATDLVAKLGLDPGYLSRILKSLEQRGLILRTRSEKDGRRRLISLAKQGDRAFADLDRRAREQLEEMLRPIADGQRAALLSAIDTIQSILGEKRVDL